MFCKSKEIIMAKEEITKYKLAWDIDNGHGVVELKTTSGVMPQIKVPGAAFTSICAILQNEKPVYFDTTSKSIYTGAEPIGEIE